MRRISHAILAAALLAALVWTPLASAAAAKKYQVTGVIVELTDQTVVVQKPDGEKWELNRDPKAVVNGELKVGIKVTLMYEMTVTSGEVKSATRPAA